MKPLYLALSGGGFHGVAHLGVLQALQTAELPIAGISGVSAGAIVAAAWAGKTDVLFALEQFSKIRMFTWFRMGRRGLFSGAKLRRLIEALVPACRIEDLEIPLRILATDVASGEAVIWKKGDLQTAVRSSISFPGIFPPVKVNGQAMADGWIHSVVPVSLAREMAGASGLVVAVDVNSQAHSTASSTSLGFLSSEAHRMIQNLSKKETAHADGVITPEIGPVGFGSPSRSKEFFQAGQKAGEMAIQKLKILMETK